MKSKKTPHTQEKEMKEHIHTKTFTGVFLACLFIISKNWIQPRCPSTEWLNKLWYMHTMEYIYYGYI